MIQQEKLIPDVARRRSGISVSETEQITGNGEILAFAGMYLCNET